MQKIQNNEFGYLGNPNIKRDGVQNQFTQEEVQEYIKCMQSPQYFATKYAKVISLDEGLVPFNLYPYQNKMFDHFNENRYSIVLACRQSGKSISSVIYLLWYAIFNSDKTIAILANKGATAREMLGRITLALENLPFFLQPGCKAVNKGSLEFSNNSKIIAASTSGSSIRGLSCVSGETKICVEDNNNIYYTEINKIINNSKFIEIKDSKMFYTVYKITNKLNNKIYIGFHKTCDLNDGYMGSGKLIKAAIEKYGIEAFDKEILKVFDTQKEAEDYEAEIVNKDFTLREDTYNIALGGNVRIMYGENNPFYGKSHTEQTRKLISQKATGRKGYSQNSAFVKGKIVDNINEIANELNIDVNVRNNVIEVCGNPDIEDVYFLNEDIQNAAYKFYFRKNESKKDGLKILSENAKKRFSGVKKSKEHRDKISKALMGIKRKNPQNKDPEKIRKTAEAHRGMKRSEESKAKMSAAKKGKPAKNIGKKYYRDLATGEGGYYVEGEQPSHYVKGVGKRS